MAGTSTKLGLILTGGGARAAYQVGVLRAIAEILQQHQPSIYDGKAGPVIKSPFQVISGTSAGALIAAKLASQADEFNTAVSDLVTVWENFSANHVYLADAWGMARSGAKWLTLFSLGWILARWAKASGAPKSLLDNSPLEGLLRQLIPLDRIPQMMTEGHLHALAITASSYTTGNHVTFYDSEQVIDNWERTNRMAQRDKIGIPHLMASAAIPFMFPAVPLSMSGQLEWFGDGAMRQTAPISPAVHLGAEKILVIGSGRMREPPGRVVSNHAYPSLAQIAGHALSNIFLDSLAIDIERLERVNKTLGLLSKEGRDKTPLRTIELLVIAPSQRLDDMAARHISALPWAVRALLRGVGVSGRGTQARGAALASYLLFESAYTREVMALGHADIMTRKEEVKQFLELI
jgi:NTE family protein